MKKLIEKIKALLKTINKAGSLFWIGETNLEDYEK